MSMSYDPVTSKAEDEADLLAEQGHLWVMWHNANVQQQAYAGLCFIFKINNSIPYGTLFFDIPFQL